jgi:hypothetical protein
VLVLLAKLGEILARVFTSMEIEAAHDSIAYHASARTGEWRSSPSPSLRRHY